LRIKFYTRRGHQNPLPEGSRRCHNWLISFWAQALGADPDRLNVHGGAIALGYPLGGSGARLMTTLVSALHDRGGRYDLQTMCEAGGMANVTIIERLRSADQNRTVASTP